MAQIYLPSGWGGWVGGVVGWVGFGVVGLAENKAIQPSLAGAWAELGKKKIELH